MITICTTRFNIQQFHVLPTQGTYMFFTDLRTNSNMVLTETWISAFLGRYGAWNGSFFYPRFGTTYRSNVHGSSSPSAQISFTSQRNPEMEKETFIILWTLNKDLALVYILSQIIPFRIVPSYSSKIRLNLILPFTRLFPLW
jgi:hypothetical protein